MHEIVPMDLQDENDFLKEHYWGIIAAQAQRLRGVIDGVSVEGFTLDADVVLDVYTFHQVDSRLDPDYDGYQVAWQYVISLDGVIVSEPTDDYIADMHRGPHVFEIRIVGGTKAFPIFKVIS